MAEQKAAAASEAQRLADEAASKQAKCTEHHKASAELQSAKCRLSSA